MSNLCPCHWSGCGCETIQAKQTLGRGYRRDLETLEGRIAAERAGQRSRLSQRAHVLTKAERAKGRETQRAAGRFTGGKFETVKQGLGA